MQDIFKKVVIFIVAAFLLSYNLSDRYLWYDEAFTALIAKNILKYGYPSAYDGKNLLTARNGADIRKLNGVYVHSEMPPLHYYLVAASFKLFGVSTETTRLPFVIIGIICVFLFGRLAQRFGISPTVASLFLALNVWFILYCRNARYYALVFLFSILLTHFYLQFFKDSSLKALSKFVVTSVLFVYTHQLTFFATHLGFLFFSLLFLKGRARLYFILAWFLPILAYLPWHYFLFYPYRGYAVLVYPLSMTLPTMIECVYITIWNINNYIAPAIFLVALPFVLPKNLRKEAILLCLLIIFKICVITIVTVRERVDRYLIGIFPLLLLLVLLVLQRIKPRKLLYYTILVALIGTTLFHRLPTVFLFKICNLNLEKFANLTTIVTGHKPTEATYERLKRHTKIQQDAACFDSYLCLYLHELFFEYKDAIEVIVNYLRKHAKPTDTFLAWFDTAPLIFYLDMKAVNRLTEGSRIKPDPTACPPEKIDWIIPQQQQPLITLATHHNFQKIVLPYPEQTANPNTPDFLTHKFYGVDYSQPNIIIYKNKKK